MMIRGMEIAHAQGTTHTAGDTDGMIRTAEMIRIAGVTGAMTRIVVMVLTVGITLTAGMIRSVGIAAMIVVGMIMAGASPEDVVTAEIGPVGLKATTEGKTVTNGVVAIGRKAVDAIGAIVGITGTIGAIETGEGQIKEGRNNAKGAARTTGRRKWTQSSTHCSPH